MTFLELGAAERVVPAVGSAPDPNFWAGRRVLVTGHTGFKGSWLSLWLQLMGAEVWGLALPPEDEDHSLFMLARVGENMNGRFVNLRNREGVANMIAEARPEYVFHLGAQAIVRRSLWDPTETWETNVLGTQHLLDALRDSPELRGVLVVTTDKVYANDGSGRPMRENNQLGGADPYSASKAACEMLVASAARCYFEPAGVRVATARGGNVIGGGDFADDRLGPDCVRAALRGDRVVLRRPESTRPWQHVLDCLNGYMLHLEAMVIDPSTPRALNIGPSPMSEIPVIEFARAMMSALGAPDRIDIQPEPDSVEAARLALDPRLAREWLDWRERLPGMSGIYAAASWYRAWRAGENMQWATLAEIERFDLPAARYGWDQGAAA
ncbi:MAG: CDP-glucose 4,6-dehydratase [Neomegalonema sp.]|nr:CDP-glucose 4,6-dehydratase [Neomegalonema sp.]